MPAMRDRLLIVVLLLPVILLHLLLGPVAQDPAYHAFADQRGWLGIPNFLNVASNLPFVAVGLAGLAGVARRPGAGRLAWAVFFGGVMLVGPGSAWYHWSPSDASLVWDRLPMTIGFIGIVVAVLAELKGRRLEVPMLAAGLLLGAYSVAHWRLFDDLRLYLAIQLTPIVAVVFVAAAWRSPSLPPRYLLAAFALYALAKLAEAVDDRIFALTAQSLSGHTIKHLLAAGAIYALYRMLSRRPPLAQAG